VVKHDQESRETPKTIQQMEAMVPRCMYAVYLVRLSLMRWAWWRGELGSNMPIPR
jgi:hypothetical protein